MRQFRLNDQEKSDFADSEILSNHGTRVLVFKGLEMIGQYHFSGTKITIGKGAEADLNLYDSRLADIQAIVHIQNDNVIISDQGEQLGVYLNGKPVKAAVLESFDLVEIGDFSLKVQIIDYSKEKEPRPISIAATRQTGGGGRKNGNIGRKPSLPKEFFKPPQYRQEKKSSQTKVKESSSKQSESLTKKLKNLVEEGTFSEGFYELPSNDDEKEPILIIKEKLFRKTIGAESGESPESDLLRLPTPGRKESSDIKRPTRLQQKKIQPDSELSLSDDFFNLPSYRTNGGDHSDGASRFERLGKQLSDDPSLAEDLFRLPRSKQNNGGASLRSARMNKRAKQLGTGLPSSEDFSKLSPQKGKKGLESIRSRLIRKIRNTPSAEPFSEDFLGLRGGQERKASDSRKSKTLNGKSKSFGIKPFIPEETFHEDPFEIDDEAPQGYIEGVIERRNRLASKTGSFDKSELEKVMPNSDVKDKSSIVRGSSKSNSIDSSLLDLGALGKETPNSDFRNLDSMDDDSSESDSIDAGSLDFDESDERKPDLGAMDRVSLDLGAIYRGTPNSPAPDSKSPESGSMNSEPRDLGTSDQKTLYIDALDSGLIDRDAMDSNSTDSVDSIPNKPVKKFRRENRKKKVPTFSSENQAKLYDLVFTGKMKEGWTLLDVKDYLQRRFGIYDNAIDRLTRGRPSLLKRMLNHEEAVKLKDIYELCGVICDLESSDETSDAFEDDDEGDYKAPAPKRFSFGLFKRSVS